MKPEDIQNYVVSFTVDARREKDDGQRVVIMVILDCLRRLQDIATHKED